MRVAVFGAGYVGLVTGACLADLGHDVVVRDILEARIDALDAARCRSTSRASWSSSSGIATGSGSRPTSVRRSRTRTSSSSPSVRRRRTPGTPT